MGSVLTITITMAITNRRTGMVESDGCVIAMHVKTAGREPVSPIETP